MDRTISCLRRLIPVWPPVPLRLWATVAAIAVASLNLAFYDEIWSRPLSEDWALVGLFLPLTLVGPQLALLLWHWPVPAAAPAWWQALFALARRLAAVAAAGASALLGLGLLVLLLFSHHW